MVAEKQYYLKRDLIIRNQLEVFSQETVENGAAKKGRTKAGGKNNLTRLAANTKGKDIL